VNARTGFECWPAEPGDLARRPGPPLQQTTRKEECERCHAPAWRMGRDRRWSSNCQVVELRSDARAAPSANRRPEGRHCPAPSRW
jgi:hypothetical protein